MLDDPAAKAAATRALHACMQADAESHPIDSAARLICESPLPGRPPRPKLVEPRLVPSRSPATPEGRAALLHAIAHIEFNAINLALDAVWRFAGMPASYYLDWLRVAAEEALHFSLLREHLAHARATPMATSTRTTACGRWPSAPPATCVARMALVPRTLEARGLDATPPLQAKLGRAGDTRAVEILDIILRDEVGHVAIGNRWYGWLCYARWP